MNHFHHLILCIFVLSGISLSAQEVRLQGHVQALGYIDDAFGGFGLGLESPTGKRFALNFDVNWGKNNQIRSTEFRPAVRYYFGQNQLGFYTGPALKYIRLKETGRNRDPQYTFGLDLGVKTALLDAFTFGVNISPHINFGGDGSGVSGQIAIGLQL